MTNDDTRNQLADISMLLRDQPASTTADITDYCVMFLDPLDSGKLYGAHLSPDKPGEPDELFNVHDVLPEICVSIADWLAHPTYTFRPNLIEWLPEAPPIESQIE